MVTVYIIEQIQELEKEILKISADGFVLENYTAWCYNEFDTGDMVVMFLEFTAG